MPSSQIGRTKQPAQTLPHSLEAEKALLGSVLLDNEALDVASEIVSKEDFYQVPNRILWETFTELRNSGTAIDAVIVFDYLRTRGLVEKAGGSAYLPALTDGVPIGTSASVTEYAKIVKDKASLRNLILAAESVIHRCIEGIDTASDIASYAQEQVGEIAAGKVLAGFMGATEIVKNRMADAESLFAPPKEHGLGTGFIELDRIMGGLHPGELTVIGARPSSGKTSLALCMAANAAIRNRVPVGVASLEMASIALLQRMICSEAKVDSHRMRGGFTTREDMGRMAKAFGAICSAPIEIDDAPSTLPVLRSKARRLKRDKGIKILFLDYLQICPSGRRFDKRVDEVGYISKALKEIAKELNIAVVALSQLSRRQDRSNRAPDLEDLRESGSIEADSDNVLLLHPEREKNDELAGSGGRTVRVLIRKQRNGPIGELPLAFLRPYTRFDNMVSRID